MKRTRTRIILTSLFLLTMAGSSFAQSTPDKLARMIIKAIRSKNTNLLRNLYYPDTVMQFKENDPGQLDAIITFAMGAAVEKRNYEIIVSDFEKQKGKIFDSKISGYRIGDEYAVYALKPEKIITINSGKIFNDSFRTLTFQAAQYGSRWYCVAPLRISKEQFQNQQQPADDQLSQ